MAKEPRELANDVIDAFADRIGEELTSSLGESNLHALHGMVREAIAEQSDAMLDRLEDELKQLRNDMVERRPLEL